MDITNIMDSSTVSDLISKVKELEQAEIPYTHKFAGGMYCRTFFPKKDTLVIGKIHKFAGFNMLLKGSVTIFDGENIVRITAPHTFITKGNDQKIGLFTEDSEFAHISTCFSQNVADAEKELFYSDETTIEQVKAWEHYNDMLILTNSTEEEIQKIVDIDNVINGTLKDFELKKSPIHGKGFFTTRSYLKGELIGNGLINGKRTELGRWVNDSHNPNTVYEVDTQGNGKVYAIRDIMKGEEITISYIKNIKEKERVTL